MGFLDRLLGREERPAQPRPGGGQQQGYQYGQQSYQQPYGAPQQPYGAPQQGGEDERAVARYRYLLRTAPPERIEEVHAEAFAQLTPEQRRMVYEEFTRTAPAGEAPRGDDPRSLAQSATRSELRQPGYMERSLGGIGGGFGGRQGSGFGSMLGASLLGTVGGYVIGSALMSAFLPDPGSFDGGTDAGAADDGGQGDTGDGSGDGGASDGGGYENASWGDGGSDFGGSNDGGGFDQDFGGDFGGGFDV
ncbi:hypothetical protein [Curtobacterium sp. MCBD17_032]|uniref:hypothetical protein n=1 Tax=Curtobacterium sp. MCBD17_032 TaxID=2175659 RepID=UPI000DAA7867|nr:hypothetical protein [Curtobacterium sp. MCBD17_032]PZE82450.1 hypothetical protein DEI91_11555 [Curtobacterium sp. MCBD17_032]